tara:strand:+ start:879 stop:1079 length:201 start_codon:yes stop_codon:yes gene_type:complete
VALLLLLLLLLFSLFSLETCLDSGSKVDEAERLLLTQVRLIVLDNLVLFKDNKIPLLPPLDEAPVD